MRLLGLNMAKGMVITLKHFLGSYIGDVKILMSGSHSLKKVRQNPDDKGVFTVQYPEQRLDLPERFRVLPYLIFDEDPSNPRCTACGICAKVCPPQCIWIKQAKDDAGRPKQLPSEFFIDTNVCMNCGFCAEFCPFDAIKMDVKFEISMYDRKNSEVYDLEKLLTPTSYYASTHPRAYEVEEANRAKKKPASAEATAGKPASSTSTGTGPTTPPASGGSA